MQRVDVAVIGGGLAGWSAAANAAATGASVVVIDRDGIGGRAATDEVDGALLNRGAHAVYPAGPGFAELRRLGIDPAGATPSTRGFLGLRGDSSGLLPVSPSALLRSSLLGTRDRVRLARLMGGLGRQRPADLARVTIDDYLDAQRLGPTAREVVAALVRLATYVADHSQVSADVAVTQLQLADAGVRYLDHGWGRLVDNLTRVACDAGAHRRRTPATSVCDTGDAVEVVVDDDTVVADRAVLAVGSPRATVALLGRSPSSWSTLGPSAEASCLDVAVTGDPPPLVLGIDEPLYLSSHGVARLAPAGRSVVHAMRYLREGEALDPRTGRSDLDSLLHDSGVAAHRVEVARYLHRMTVCSALPLAEHGGMAGRPAATDTGSSRLLVAGDWVGPIGHLADASISSGAAAGRLAADRACRSARA
ncbi:MAG: NAD(P)-binding protein [Acidimicrobiales bacterium]